MGFETEDMDATVLEDDDVLLSAQWGQLRERLAAIHGRLLGELEASWQESRAPLSGQSARLAAGEPAADLARTLFLEPFSQWEMRQPCQRALRALEAYDRALDEAVRSLPASLPASGPLALAALNGLAPAGLPALLARREERERPLALAATVADGLRRAARERLRVEGPYFRLLASAGRHLLRPWEAARLAQEDEAQAEAARELQAAAEAQAAALDEQAAAALDAWRRWPEALDRALARKLLDRVVWGEWSKNTPEGDPRAAGRDRWGEQCRLVHAELRLETAIIECSRRLAGLARELDLQLREEWAGLQDDLTRALLWLRAPDFAVFERTFPAPQTEATPAGGILSELDAAVRAAGDQLPEAVDLPVELTASAARRVKMRPVRPRSTLLAAYAGEGRDEVGRALGEVEAEHSAVLQEIGRVREVIAFALGSAEREEQPDPQVLREAASNSISLLEEHHRPEPRWRAEVRPRVAGALEFAVQELRGALTSSGLVNRAYAARRELRRSTRLGLERGRPLLARARERAVAGGEGALHRFLAGIGWLPAPPSGGAEILTRPFLPREFTIDLSAKELPAIYRRLFRFEAVSEPSLLVGRQEELAAIAQARGMWEDGRPVALLLVGTRGSGKTSLLNCALKRHLAGLEVIRGEFSRRVASEEELRVFIAGLCRAGDPAGLEDFFAERRRVVVLEELERAFLRQVGHFAAVRALQRLIAATCSTTLWVLATNQVAFSFLDASLHLGDSFSHRINASLVGPEALRQAILRRHRLSGLRLAFAPLPEEARLQAQVRRLAGPVDPETAFFESLARASGGIFRSAFAIWLEYIDTVEAGVLRMKPLLTPDLSPVIEGLAPEHLFTLVAILQHGSLTPEEHALIFQEPAAVSRANLDELLAREILESDPGRPGLRIQSEAMRVVYEALYRRSLL